MSRDHVGIRCLAGRFPRVSGDEPEIEYTLDPTALFSPRERG